MSLLSSTQYIYENCFTQIITGIHVNYMCKKDCVDITINFNYIIMKCICMYIDNAVCSMVLVCWWEFVMNADVKYIRIETRYA